MKTCSKCGITKNKSDFRKRKANKDGLQGQCKVCMTQYDKKYRETEHAQEYIKQYRQNNKERAAKTKALWEERNKEHLYKYRKSYREKNKDKIKKYLDENKEYIKQYKIKYREQIQGQEEYSSTGTSTTWSGYLSHIALEAMTKATQERFMKDI